MRPSRDLDFTPLTRSVDLRARLRAATANNLMVLGGTLGALLVVVPTSVFIGLLATGNATDVGGLVLLAMCFGAGAYVIVDILRKSGGSGALDSFAQANDLVLIRGSMVPQYAGSLFADESHAVHQSVRTRDELFVEVGERFPTTPPQSSAEPNRPQLFLRAQLAGRAAGDPHEAVTPDLHDELTRFAGPYVLEVSGHELTLFGSEGLAVERPGRVQDAFALADELAARVDAALGAVTGQAAYAAAPGSTLSGFRIPVETRPEPPRGSRPRPLVVVGWTLALMIGGSLAIAIVMSVIDGQLRERDGAARLVVSLIVAAAIATAAWLGKKTLTARRTDRSGTPTRQRPSRRRGPPWVLARPQLGGEALGPVLTRQVGRHQCVAPVLESQFAHRAQLSEVAATAQHDGRLDPFESVRVPMTQTQ